MNLSMTIHGDKKLASDLKNSKTVIYKKANKFLSVQALETNNTAKKEAPVDMGYVQSSINVDRDPIRLGYTVKARAKHAIFAHEGRKPGKMPPFHEGSSLASWSRRKGIPAFAVARSIALKGTKGKKFMDIAYKQQRPIFKREAKQLLNEIVKGL